MHRQDISGAGYISLTEPAIANSTCSAKRAHNRLDRAQLTIFVAP